MTINICICDDEDYYIEELQNLIQIYAREYSVDFNIHTFHSGKELLDWTETDGVSLDFVFLDVDMPLLNGIETAKKIRTFSEDMVICFVTSFDNYALTAYDVDAIGYIVKPAKYSAVNRILTKAAILIQHKKDALYAAEHYIEIPVNRTTCILDLNNIIYIEKRRNQCLFHCKDGETMCYDTLNHIYKKLNPDIFIYTHQGYIVNFNHIKEVANTVVYLSCNMEVPISRRNYSAIRTRHMNKIVALSKQKYNEVHKGETANEVLHIQ